MDLDTCYPRKEEKEEIDSIFRTISSLKKTFDPWLNSMQKLQDEETNVLTTISYLKSCIYFNESMAKLASVDLKALTRDEDLFDIVSRMASASKCNATVIQGWDKMHRQSSSVVLKNSRESILSLTLQKFEALIHHIHFDQTKLYIYIPLAVYQHLNALVQLDATTLALSYLLQKYLSLMMPFVKSLPSSEPIDIVKSILSLLDFCGKFFVQDMTQVSRIEGLSNFHSWQYLYAPFLDHMMDEMVTLLRKYCTCIKLTSLFEPTPSDQDIRYIESMNLQDIDFILNDLARVFHQFRSLEFMIQFYEIRHDQGDFGNESLERFRAAYISLERNYFCKAVNKAIAIQEIVFDESVFTSVEDSFFLLKKIVKRFGFSLNITSWNESLFRLLGDFVALFVKLLLSDTFSESLEKSPSGSSTPSPEKAILTQINSLALTKSMFCEYLDGLEDELVSHEEWKMHVSKDNSLVWQSAIKKLHVQHIKSFESIMSQVTNALTKELLEYFEIRFYPLVKEILENRMFTKSEYYQANPVGSNYSGSLDFAQGASTEFIERVKLYLSKMIRLIQTGWIKCNRDFMLLHFVDKLVKHWENYIHRQSFTLNGSYLLEDEIRKAIKYTQELTELSVRDKFSRLVLIARVLTVENIQELETVIASSHSLSQKNNPLPSRTECHKIFSLRTDMQ